MAKSKIITGNVDKNDLESRFRRLQNPEVKNIIGNLDSQYGKNAMPIEKLRKIIDKEMGDKTLTDELYKMREEQ